MRNWTVKTKEEFNFKFWGEYDVSKLKDIVLSYDNEWLIDTSRQETIPTHKYTQSYIYVDFPLNWTASQGYVAEYKTTDQRVLDVLNPIIKDLEQKHDGRVGRAIVLKLKDDGLIPPHEDRGEYLITARRCHIPLVTNPNVFFTVDASTINMKQGECWEINNSRTHSVKNNSNLERIHLVIDIIPNEFLTKGENK
jgi:hypothetical protein